MGSRSSPRRLVIWMNGIPVGYWERTRGSERLAYFDRWVDHEQGRPLSLSLPFLPDNASYRGQIVSDYFENLLPDSDAIRRRLALRHHAEGTDAFELLAKLGRDCVGAIQLLPEDEAPSGVFEIRSQTLTEAAVAARLRGIPSASLMGQTAEADDLRLSLAGAQEKTALLRQGKKWSLPLGNTPTTHILKLPLGLVGHMQADMRTSVENEWLCARIVNAYGISVAHCEIEYFEDQKALVVERFDRTLSNDKQWIIRLPQEDMCQATGTSPLRKYQADGGPGIAQIMALLLGSAQADQDRLNFFKTQVIFWVLAATDGHAKNFSITHLPRHQYRATPLYDVLSAHPVMGPGKSQLSPKKVRLAMAIRGSSNHYLLDKIQPRHWIEQARQIGLETERAAQILADIADTTGTVIEQVAQQLPQRFPMDLAEAIFTGMKRQAARLMPGR